MYRCSLKLNTEAKLTMIFHCKAKLISIYHMKKKVYRQGPVHMTEISQQFSNFRIILKHFGSVLQKSNVIKCTWIYSLWVYRVLMKNILPDESWHFSLKLAYIISYWVFSWGGNHPLCRPTPVILLAKTSLFGAEVTTKEINNQHCWIQMLQILVITSGTSV